MSPVPGAICTFAPSLTGIVSTGTQISCSTTGLAIPIMSGTVGLIVIKSTVVAGIDTAAALNFIVRASLAID